MNAAPFISFEPDWRVIAGPIIAEGKGLLSAVPANQREHIEWFALSLGDVTVGIKPKLGQIFLGSQQVLQLEGAAKLIWSRIMRKELQVGADKNSVPFFCAYYQVGLEDCNGNKHGWRVYGDGRMLKGIS